ncbi:MAG TPA: GEVED domain-containing protein [Arenimonas sp.]|nr:GEVED domain-containing protein [Arenimonas sp.]
MTSAIAAQPTLWVSNQGRIQEYTLDGVQISDGPIVAGADGLGRDLVALTDADVAVYNGTFEASVAVGNSAGWIDYRIPGFSTVNNGTYGGITFDGTWVYATDMRTFGSAEQELSGVVRIDPVSGAYTRFLSGTDLIDISLGQDGKLYALADTYGRLLVIDPGTMSVERQLSLGHTSSSRAVTADAEGNIYMASWSGWIAKYDSQAVEVSRITTGASHYDIDLASDGTLVASDRQGNVHVSNTDLSSVTSFPVRSDWLGVFVAINEPMAPPPPTYCEAAGESTQYEWINAISVNGSSHISGNNGGYADFTGDEALNLRAGSNTVTLTPGLRKGKHTLNWLVALDVDSDGTFETQARVSGKQTVTATLNVPGTVQGPVRLRVAASYFDLPEACGTFSWGEVQDHTALIQ